jgi:type II secretory pathway pseudopilin PulG
MSLFLSNNKAFTLIELLVGFIVGTIMAAAIYFSYTIFSSSYQAIIEKTSVNRALRATMNDITLNVRKAGYVDPNQYNPDDTRNSFSWNMNGKSYNYKNNSIRIHGSPLIYFNGGSAAPDALAIYFDDNALNMRYISYMGRVEPDGIRYLMRTEYKCLPRSLAYPSGGCQSLDNEKMFSNLETIKFTFFDKYGVPLPVSAANKGTANFTYWTGAITASIDPLAVNYVEISIIFKSQNEIYKNNQAKTFTAGGKNFSYNDNYYREILTASVYPRNIITSK